MQVNSYYSVLKNPNIQNNHYKMNISAGLRQNLASDQVSFKRLDASGKNLPAVIIWNTFFSRSVKASRRINSSLTDDLKKQTKFVQIKTIDNKILNCWDIQPKGTDKYVLFCHGAAQNISANQNLYKEINKKGFGVFALEYRGFGLNKKTKVNEELMKKDVDAAFNYLLNKTKNIHVVGHSLGAALSSKFAVGNNFVKSVILVAPVDGVLNVSNNYLLKKTNFLPNFLIKILEKYPKIISPSGQAFTCSKEISKLEAPTFIIQSKNDKVFSLNVAEKLARKAKNLADFIVLPSGGHRMDESKIETIVGILTQGK